MADCSLGGQNHSISHRQKNNVKRHVIQPVMEENGHFQGQQPLRRQGRRLPVRVQ